MILTLRALPSTQIQKDQVAPVQYLVSGCTPGSDRSQGCKSRRPDEHNDVRKASNTPPVLFSEPRRKQPSQTMKMSIITPFSVPLRIPQVVIVCPKREETAMSPFLRSKSVTDGRKCPKNGTQKPDHLIRTGSSDPVGGIDTRGPPSGLLRGGLGLPLVSRRITNRPCLGSLAPSGLCQTTSVALLGRGVACTFPLLVSSGPPTFGTQGLLISFPDRK